MRRVARAHGAPFAFHEVVLDRLVLTPGKASRRILTVPDDDHPVGGQLMGSEPDTFGRAAKELVGAGYDVVDVNFGCPVPRILNRSRGGSCSASRPPRSRSWTRSSRRSPGTSRSWSRCAAASTTRRRPRATSSRSSRASTTAASAAVTLHGRTVEQRYVGRSRWAFLARVKRHVGARTLLGSGDLFSPFAVRRMLAETGVDGVTVARGCIGNPFAFAQCRAAAGRRRAAVSVARAAARSAREALARGERALRARGARLRASACGQVREAAPGARARARHSRARQVGAAFEAAVQELYDGRRYACPARPLVEADERRRRPTRCGPAAWW
jgi:tRNA-dihydrouridine synthase